MRSKVISVSSFIGLLLLIIPHHVQSSHVIGSSLHYDCLGGCTYRVIVNEYYDCTAAATPALPGPGYAPSIGWDIDSVCGLPDTIGYWVSASYSEVTPICPGFQSGCTTTSSPINGYLESRYYRDFDLCSQVGCSPVKVTWGTCCRSIGIISPTYALYHETEIDLGLSACNNAPRFDTPPNIMIPAGVPSTYNFSATDPDGDSLVYRLIPCYTAPNTPIGLQSPYTPQTPLGSTWDVQLDSLTGQLTFLPTPGQLVQGAMCIGVEEYRNGIRIGMTTRDLTIVSWNLSPNNKQPQFDSTSLVSPAVYLGYNTYEIPLGSVFRYYALASDSNAVDSLRFSIDSPLAGFHNTISGINPISTQIDFTPTDTGVHVIALRVSDNVCPLNGYAHHIIRVKVVNPYLTADITEAPCGNATGAIDLGVVALGPFQYLWSTGDTTEDISNLLPGIYSVTVTNNAGLSLQDTFVISANNIVLTDSLVTPLCSNDSSGSIITQIQGGVAPYTYLWNTGDTTTNLSNIPAGGYSVTITDSLGCPRHKAFILPQADSCFNVIAGRVYEDQNGNCMFDAGDIALANRMVDIWPGGAVMTDANGAYSFQVDTGTFALEAVNVLYQQVICPVGGKDSVTFTTVGNVHQGLDFAMQTDSVQDLRVAYSHSIPRPGRNVTHNLNVYNDGTSIQNGQLSWTHDPIFDFLGATPPATAYDSVTRTVTWNLNQMPGFGTRLSFQVNSLIPPTYSFNTPFTNTAQVTPIQGDSTPSNNVISISDVTRGAFDPNDKQVSPQGLGGLGLIEQSQQALDYTIRFQNTGNDTAFFVILRDTLSPHLDVFSFQPQVESHPYSLQVEHDSVLVFTFSNILLPDSSTNLIESQGFVSFSMQLQDSLPVSTQIQNRAAIYFDFNPPVITNEVVNTLAQFPEVTLGSDTSICSGEPLYAELVKHGTPPYTFHWQNSTVDSLNFSGVSSLQATQSGPYRVIVTDAIGISHTSEIDVRVLPLPDASFTFQIAGQQVSFAATYLFSQNWTWDFGDGRTINGLNRPIITYANKGIYWVKLIVENSCGYDTVTQQVDLGGLNIPEEKEEVKIVIVPHPVKDISYLHFPNPNQESYSLRLFDMQGRLLKTYPAQRGKSFKIEKGCMKSGLYIFELRGKNTYFSKMVIK